MTQLAGQRCESCTKDTPTLTDVELDAARHELSPEWDVQGAALRRDITTRDFAEAFVLATRIALIAEAEGHHPDLHVGWGHLAIELSTHVAGGLTKNDVILAAKIDRAIGGT